MFKNGHMRRRNPCVACETPTRRTVLCGDRRYVVCKRCELPDAQALVMLDMYERNTGQRWTLPRMAARAAGFQPGDLVSWVQGKRETVGEVVKPYGTSQYEVRVSDKIYRPKSDKLTWVA
jgi:hypothetical protein